MQNVAMSAISDYSFAYIIARAYIICILQLNDFVSSGASNEARISLLTFA